MPGGRQVLGCSVCPTLQQRPARLSPDKDHVLSAPSTGALERGPRREGQTLAHRQEHLALPEPTPAPSPWNLPQESTPPGVVSCTSPTASTVSVPLTSDPESKTRGRPAQTAPRAPLPRVPNTNSQRKALTRSITNVPCISGIVPPCISAGPLVLSEVPAAETHIQGNCPRQPRSCGLSKAGPWAH